MKLETAYKTPYEKYVRENIDAERQNLDNLYNEFAKANSLEKQVIKRRIDETLQNIDLLQQELRKYGAGLTWLREPSKNRDDKASHLEKIQEEKPATPPPAAKPAAAGQRPTIGAPVGKPQVGTTPKVGAPVGKPTVGTPVGTRPQIGSPVGAKPQAGAPASTSPQPESKPAAPQGVTPISARPRIGTPIVKKTEEEKS